MSIQLTGRHLTLTEGQKSYVEKKIDRLHRLTGKIDEVAFTLSMEKSHYVAEFNFRAGVLHAFTKSSDSDALVSIDKAAAKLEAQISKLKNKRFGKKNHARHGPPPEDLEEIEA